MIIRVFTETKTEYLNEGNFFNDNFGYFIIAAFVPKYVIMLFVNSFSLHISMLRRCCDVILKIKHYISDDLE